MQKMDQQKNESRASNEWRNKQFAKMLETGSGADVFFRVGRADEEKQLICAHKCILSAVSPAFEGQFLRFNEMTGTWEGSTEQSPIEVPDVGADAFRALLRYIYAGDFSGVNKQNVLEVYYAGEKYMIKALVKECRQWLLNRKNLGVDNVCSVLKFAQCHGDKTLIRHCWTCLDKKIGDLVDPREMMLLEQADLCELFSRDTLAADEFALFLWLNLWAVHKCATNGLEQTPENKRKVIGAAIYQIRFPLLSQQQFTDFIVPTDLLSKDDMLVMYVQYSSSNNCSADEANKTAADEGKAAATTISYCASGFGKTRSKYPNRFNGKPRTSQFRISIESAEEGEEESC